MSRAISSAVSLDASDVGAIFTPKNSVIVQRVFRADLATVEWVEGEVTKRVLRHNGGKITAKLRQSYGKITAKLRQSYGKLTHY